MTALEKQLNAPTKQERLNALQALASAPAVGTPPGNVGNHFQTIYSFSPYSPSMALYRARQSGAAAAGILDHDTLAGAPEFVEAGRIFGVAVSCGVGCRADFTNTPFAKYKINHPDQAGVIHMSLHGVPSRSFSTVQAFFAPYRAARNRRNRQMTANINALTKPFGIRLDFERDVLSLSMAHDGGAVTERHLEMALCRALLCKFGRGAALLSVLENRMGLEVAEKQRIWLADGANPYYEYDLLDVIEDGFAPRFYADATEECPKAARVLDLARSTGSISAYPYLSDTGGGAAGGKRARKFEDDFLDELMQSLKDLGFMAVTYMPSRNTRAQIARVRKLCEKHGFFQISGEDIHSPRQSHFCEALQEPEFQNLVESAWALAEHGRLSDGDPGAGLFSEETIRNYPDIGERVKVFAEKGKEMFH